MQIEVRMHAGMREIILRRHDFIVEQVKSRLLMQFANVEEEADRYADAEYDRLGSMPYDENMDMADVAEIATDHAQEFYSDLTDLKRQITLSMLAAIFHHWEKTLREHIERKLAHYMPRQEAERIAWKRDIDEVFKQIHSAGWECCAESFFPHIDACRLIVNVYKHGKGPSLDLLAARYRKYVSFPSAEQGGLASFLADYWDYEWLSVNGTQFDELVNGLRAFWEHFPVENSQREEFVGLSFET